MGQQIVKNNFHVVFLGRALISVLKIVYNLKKSVLLARHHYIITTITGRGCLRLHFAKQNTRTES